MTPTVFQDRSGKATNGWELWESDLDLVAGMNLNAYRFSVEWARIEPVEGEFSEEALAHYEALVDGCLARGLAPIVTFNHFTSPHWFAARGAWLDAEAPELFARYCGVVMDRFGDRIRLAVTFNEPDLPEMLTWADLPDFIVELERATLEAASREAGVERYRAGNVMLREDFAGMRAGMTAGHRAAKAAIKARRARPAGRPVARDRATTSPRPAARSCAIASAPRSTSTGSCLPATTTSSACRTTSASSTAPTAWSPAAEGADVNGMGTAVEPDSLRGAVEYAYSVARVPVLVSEHGIGTEDDSIRAGFIEPSLEGLAAGDRGRRAGARLLPLDAHGQLRVDLRLRPEARPARGRPRDVRAHGEAERGRVCRARPNARGVCELIALLTFPIRKASR